MITLQTHREYSFGTSSDTLFLLGRTILSITGILAPSFKRHYYTKNPLLAEDNAQKSYLESKILNRC